MSFIKLTCHSRDSEDKNEVWLNADKIVNLKIIHDKANDNYQVLLCTDNAVFVQDTFNTKERAVGRVEFLKTLMR